MHKINIKHSEDLRKQYARHDTREFFKTISLLVLAFVIVIVAAWVEGQ